MYVANFAPKYVRQASNPNAVLYSQDINKEEYAKNKDISLEYIQIAKKFVPELIDNLINNIVEDVSNNFCDCGENNFDKISKSLLICKSCGSEKNIDIEDDMTYKDLERVNMNKKVTYEKRNYFKDIMNKYQGKELKIIPPIIIEKLEENLKENKIENSKIERGHIRESLSRIGYSEYCENTNNIYHIITNKSLPDISYLEDIILEDFERLYKVFLSNPGIEKNGFFNNQYILYQLLRKNGYKCKLEEFKMMKTDVKKMEHQQDYTKCANVLKWNVFPLI